MKKLLMFVFVCSLLVACNKKIEETPKPEQLVNAVKNGESKNVDKINQEILKDVDFKETFENNTKTICATATLNNERHCFFTIFDKNNNKIKSVECETTPRTNTCKKEGKEKTYDTKGNLTKERECNKYGENNNCIEWRNYGKDYKYDENNNMIWERGCSWVDKNGDKCLGKSDESNYYHDYENGSDYTYDKQNRKTRKKECDSFDKDGVCKNFGKLTEYKYDQRGNLTEVEECFEFDFIYNKNQQKKQDEKECFCTKEHGCGCASQEINADMDFSCPKIGTYETTEDYIVDDYIKELYTYNSQEFLIAKKEKDSYEKYLLDKKGNILVKQILNSRDLRIGEAIEYEYNDKGRVTTERDCKGIDNHDGDVIYSGVDLKEDGHCKNFENKTIYTYDDKDNLTSKKYCYYRSCYEGKCIPEEDFCEEHSTITNYTYDSNNNLIKEEKIEKDEIYTIIYIYDENSNLIRKRYLKNGQYSSNEDNGFGIDINYNQKGKIIKLRYCLQVDANGNCQKTGYGQNYIYDSDGNLFMILWVTPQEKTYLKGNLYTNETFPSTMKDIKDFVPEEYQSYTDEDEVLSSEDVNVEVSNDYVVTETETKELDGDDWHFEDNTPLCKAIKEKNLQKVKEILKEEKNINDQENCVVHYDDVDKCDFSPLTFAIERNSLNILKELIRSGANVNTEISCEELDSRIDSWKPLHIALNGGASFSSGKVNKDIVEELLIAGADANSKNEAGETPLELTKNEETVKVLLKYGAKDSLVAALYREDLESFNKLLKTADLKDKNKALIKAVVGRNISLIKKLIGVGADVNAEFPRPHSESGLFGGLYCEETPLSVALDKEYNEISTLLKEHKAKENICTAVKSKDLQRVKYAIAAGADLSKRYPYCPQDDCDNVRPIYLLRKEEFNEIADLFYIP